MKRRKAKVRVCVVCGGTGDRACFHPETNEICRWVTDRPDHGDLCSACEGKEKCADCGESGAKRQSANWSPPLCQRCDTYSRIAHTSAEEADLRAHDVADLAVFPPTLCSIVPMFNRTATYSEKPVPGTWHWPERE